ncbi:MAG TPA: class I SAM-dependent methyltransferase [Blastocatellia bacterium]|nr:class I SAM-dependent methyltransferase [Blastocatellia bacterium]
MSDLKELAFRYDLFVTPDWRDRFDTLVNENVEIPAEGRVLDVNCGTGAHSIELAERLRGKGEVVGIDPSAERIDLASAKALAKKLDDVKFQQGTATALPVSDDEFDVAIGDASMLATGEIEHILTEMIRVTKPEGRVVLKVATRGSFDEFFSIYWEALLTAELVDEVWPKLDYLINERRTISDVELIATKARLRNVDSFTSNEIFIFETGEAVFTSPLIEDFFLEDWLAIVPESRRREVRDRIVSIIDNDRHGAPFEVSIKTTVISGTKQAG